MKIKVIKRALQDIGRSRFIDDLGPAFARHVDIFNQDAFNRVGRKTFIPKQDRQIDIILHFVDKGINPVACLADRAVKFTRKTDDDAADILLGDDCRKFGNITREFLCAKSANRGRDL